MKPLAPFYTYHQDFADISTTLLIATAPCVYKGDLPHSSVGKESACNDESEVQFPG